MTPHAQALDRLYSLLPAIYRVRDAEQRPDGAEPLRALLSILAEPLAVLDEDLAQRYDDHFIETCADWVVPYIGDLLGYEPLSGAVPSVSSPRAEVARLLAARRRKGTAAMLQQLARDVSGWNAAAVEYFLRLSTSQYMNHIRASHATSPDLRPWEPLERVGTPFDSIPRTADVRSIATGAGLYNIPNVGVFLWRLTAYPLTGSDAVRVDDRRYLFHPAGISAPLFTLPATEPAVITHAATAANAPLPLTRRALYERKAAHYGPGRSLFVKAAFDGGALEDIGADSIRVCDLRDATGSGWVHAPAAKIAIDPELGRIAFPPGPVPTRVVVSFHYGFGMDIGGGEYARAFPGPLPRETERVQISQPADLAAALTTSSPADRVVEILNSGRYEAPDRITIGTRSLTIGGADGARPTLAVNGSLEILSAVERDITLDGLLIVGGAIVIPATHPDGRPNLVRRVRLRHCTIVPSASASIRVAATSAILELDRCITGPLRIIREADVIITDSIVDATAEDQVAFAALDGAAPGGSLEVVAGTIVGKVHTSYLKSASNTIFAARLNAGGDAMRAPLRSERKQHACVRFSYIPWQSIVGRRYRCCEPASEDESLRLRPQFATMRYGEPRYGDLAARCTPAVRRGADDEGEMGAYHEVHAPQRERNVRLRVEEHLRFGLEAGVMFASDGRRSQR